mmetsp:Transcript_73124/g.188625  ORF Transcript_73124/g.188625 Transcript_73124/m.188625 type:complete len:226 (-) Transcript_73124:594-1271(-)
MHTYGAALGRPHRPDDEGCHAASALFTLLLRLHLRIRPSTGAGAYRSHAASQAADHSGLLGLATLFYVVPSDCLICTEAAFGLLWILDQPHVLKSQQLRSQNALRLICDGRAAKGARLGTLRAVHIGSASRARCQLVDQRLIELYSWRQLRRCVPADRLVFRIRTSRLGGVEEDALLVFEAALRPCLGVQDSPPLKLEGLAGPATGDLVRDRIDVCFTTRLSHCR